MKAIVFFKLGTGTEFQSLPVTTKGKKGKAKAAIKMACKALKLNKPKPLSMPLNGCGKDYYAASHNVCGIAQEVVLTVSFGRHSG